MTSTKPAVTTNTKAAPKTAPKAAPKASTKPATKASATKEATATELRRNAARNADRMPDLGDYKEGDEVATADGREWTVVGPAQGNTTLKLTREQDGKKESVFRFARNIKRVGK
ncbi:hypothetical protein [Arthrobacter sp. D2-10]